PGPFGQSETVYLRAYLNEANGSWVVGARHAVATLNTVPLPLPVVTPLRIKAYRASLDGDAIDDVQVRVFDPRNATASLFGSLGTANGVFLDAGMAGLDVSNAELVWHDLDFDGDDDLVLTNPLQSCVRLMNSSPMPQPSEWLSVEHLIRAKGFMGQGWTIPPRLRLRDLATGCPVAGRTLSVAYRRPDGVGTTMSLTTDASGELALPPTFGVAEGELIALVSGTTFAPRVVEASVYRFSLFKNLAPPSGGPFVSTRFRKGPGQPAVLSLVADLPQLPLPTPFGTIHTSVLAPGPGLLAIDGLGLLGSPDPAGVAAPEFFRVFSIPSGLPPGLALTVQAYSMDLDFGWPDALVITPPHQIVF
ncbi:MAG: hypothetical protein KDB53_15580, partial [Planctomycetes bacterium]|nr:hypothetical protein [Planctomycetota bacterium]